MTLMANRTITLEAHSGQKMNKPLVFHLEMVPCLKMV